MPFFTCSEIPNYWQPWMAATITLCSHVRLRAETTLKRHKNMTKEEILTKVSELVDSAWEFGFAKGVNETSATYMAKLKEKQKAIEDAYDAGYVDGHKAALAGVSLSNPTEDEVENEITCNLTNTLVDAFVHDVNYDAPGFATSAGKSVVTKYTEGNLVPNKYGENWIEHCVCVNTGKGKYWNLIPGRVYTLDGLRVRTTGNVRQIHFPADEYVSNCRDLGGWKCEGGTVKYGYLIRSAYIPAGLTRTGAAATILREDVGVTLEIDLRGQEAYTGLGWSGVSLPIYGYATILTSTKNVKVVFERIFQEVLKGGCVLYHCHAGADRTGTVTALILGLLGVSEADIIKDWELTSFCHWCNFKIISQWAERIADPKYKSIALSEFPKGELREFFVAMKKAYGTKGETFQQQCEAYLTKKIGFADAQLTKFKKAMIQIQK